MRLETDPQRLLIRLRIRDGRLPRIHVFELWRGRSAGPKACDGCGVPIRTNEQASLICADDWRIVRLHEDCFQIWDLERQPRDADRINVGA